MSAAAAGPPERRALPAKKNGAVRMLMRAAAAGLVVGGAWHTREHPAWTDPRCLAAVGAALLAGRKLVAGFKKPVPTDGMLEYDADTRPGTTGVLLVNLGTPEGRSVADVRRFLKEFLSDERVIDAPSHCRWMLVNLIIAPFRAKYSAEMYGRIWDPELKDSNMGSPILRHGVELCEKVKQSLGSTNPGKFHVELCMRYQSPSIEDALLKLRRRCVEHIVVVPLFPQYSSACTGSIHQKVFDCMRNWDRIPNLTLSSDLMNVKAFVDTFAKNAEAYMKREYDHYVFSYHGVPEKQILKGSLECQPSSCSKTGCCSRLTERNRLCYRAACHETSRRIAAAVGITQDDYTTTFQSRLGPTKWLQPYTDETLEACPAQGQKRVLVFSPAFVADCLETIDEIGSELKHQFLEKGGEQMDLVPSLNSEEMFAEGLADLVCTETLPSSSSNTHTHTHTLSQVRKLSVF